MNSKFIIVLFALFELIVGRAAGLIIIDLPDQAMVVPPTANPRIPNANPPANPRMPFVPDWPRQPRAIFRFTPLEIQSVKIESKIKDQMASTRIEEEFYNPNPNRLEGTFYLPLPKGAHLKDFKLEVNGKMTSAELLSADKAKNIYEEIVRKAQDPALLEYIGRDLLKVRIFPIEPHSTKRVEVSYSELLELEAGLSRYSLPLNTAQYCATPIKNLSAKIELQSSTPLKTIYSPTFSPEITRHGDKRAVVGLELNSARPQKDFQLFFSLEPQELGVSFLSYKKAGEAGYFMLLATPSMEATPVLPKDVVFVMDTSGSMSGQKIDQARKALRFCIQSLNGQDRFEIIRFSTEAERLFRKLEDANSSNRAKAEEFVDELKATGGTAINDALKSALETRPAVESNRPFIVVFVTDGLPTIGETSQEKILENIHGGNRSAGIRIFCFGIGTDVNTHLLDKLSEETRAATQYVLPDEDMEVKISNFFAKISEPALTDVELDFASMRVSKLQPSKLPDIFKGQQVVAFGRYHSGGRTSVTLSGKAGERSKTFKYPVEFTNDSSEHEFIPRLWATRRVGYLLEEIRLRGETSELKEEVTTLAREYGIVTPYTSFLVTEDASLAASRPELSLGRTGSDQALPKSLSAAHNQIAPTRDRLASLSLKKSGDAGVAGARYNVYLKDASTETEALTAPSEIRQFAMEGKLLAKGESRIPEAERIIGTRRFRLDGNQWRETSIQKAQAPAPVRLEFNSQDYWKFAAQHPDLGTVLALGTDITFMYNGKLYEIYTQK